MPALLPHIDPDGLLEFSVVYTDRALNHMSQRFQGVMRDISTMLKSVYAAKSSVLVPGSGRFVLLADAYAFALLRDICTAAAAEGWPPEARPVGALAAALDQHAPAAVEAVVRAVADGDGDVVRLSAPRGALKEAADARTG
jgi:hypothetical protein